MYKKFNHEFITDFTADYWNAKVFSVLNDKTTPTEIS